MKITMNLHDLWNWPVLRFYSDRYDQEYIYVSSTELHCN